MRENASKYRILIFQMKENSHQQKINKNIPGAAYPYVPANEVQLDESGLKNLAAPKSEI